MEIQLMAIMSIPKLAFHFLTITLVLLAALGADPISQTCSNSYNFTTYSPYTSNLNTLMGYLYFGTPMTGFGLGVIGQRPNQVYGLAICRANVSSSDCKTRVVNATSEIRKSCPYGKQAKIRYDNCFLKYSSENFCGQIDNENQILIFNPRDPSAFNRKTRGLLRNLSNEASETSNFCAAGSVELGGSDKVYGLAKCTRDLSCDDSLKCLDGLIDQLPNCCDGKQGARIISGSCIIRYETYPFL